MVLYLYLASSLWVRPGQEVEPTGPAEAFYWLFVLAPILLFYCIVNIVALIVTIRRFRSSGFNNLIILWSLVAAFWVITMTYDSLRYYS